MKIIKRYPSNRRLYDTETSAYITINNVRSMVRSGVAFQVLCHSTKNDVTNQTLKQCLAEGNVPTDILVSLIRY